MPFDKSSLMDAQCENEQPEPTGLVRIYIGLLVVFVLWGASVALFGLPGLYLPAVMAVPVIFVLLIRLTLG